MGVIRNRINVKAGTKPVKANNTKYAAVGKLTKYTFSKSYDPDKLKNTKRYL